MTCIYKVGDCVTPPNSNYAYFIIQGVDFDRILVKTFFRNGAFRFEETWSVGYINSCVKYNPKIVAKRCRIG